MSVATAKRQCAVDECRRKVVARGWCSTHYSQWQKRGDPEYSHFGFKGQSEHALYYTWRSMRRRCDTPSQGRYESYGGRGIKVCDRWNGRHGFANFLEDMGEKPSPDHQLDRIDNDGDYTPENCRWATRSENQLNKRTGRDNTSGFTGVSRFKNNRGKWYWRARVGKKTIGYYETLEEAISARLMGETVYKEGELLHE